MATTWQQRLNGEQKARRRRMLAAAHVLAKERFGSADDPTGADALRQIVIDVCGGRVDSCGDCFFDELGAVLDRLNGKTPRRVQHRGAGPTRPKLDQAGFVRKLSLQVSERFPEKGEGEFGDVLLKAKVGTCDVDLMTASERRQAINLLKTYLGGCE